MFTGIVEEAGIIQSVEEQKDGARFFIQTTVVNEDAREGDSIAVNGVCLTVEKRAGNILQFFTLPETLSVTNLKTLSPGNRVNLERAVQFETRLGGHIVQGHVEDKASVRSVETREESVTVWIDYRSPYLIPRGSITVDGISLTLHGIDEKGFRLELIPETLDRTNAQDWKTGTIVNIENDYLVKTIDHLLQARMQEKQNT